MDAREKLVSKFTRKDLLKHLESNPGDREFVEAILAEFDEVTVNEVKHTRALRRLALGLHILHKPGLLSQMGEFTEGD